jgi:hypothetical protein
MGNKPDPADFNDGNMTIPVMSTALMSSRMILVRFTACHPADIFTDH